ncbi:hypothetical protein [Micromonospora zhanjiangensis]|uniref:Uncharacterized protein n=1 Tax=Micromonospora zhanjiangensis TaxID=1522057 RepID=A0ABV8KWR8_9ACTN
MPTTWRSRASHGLLWPHVGEVNDALRTFIDSLDGEDCRATT